MARSKIAFAAADNPSAKEAMERLTARYEHVPPDEAEVIVALGGDGFMLVTLHSTIGRPVSVYGMNRGSVGFLMNEYGEDDLMERLANAAEARIHPLRMRATTIDGETVEGLAINEVSMLRETRQTAKLQLRIDGVMRLPELMCDGVLVATPAGSTAYNLSAHGPIIPIGAELLAVTPISAFRPRRWRGALLPDHITVKVEVLEAAKRPVSAVADYTEVRDVAEVEIRQEREAALSLLFDPEHNLEERIIKEQFLP